MISELSIQDSDYSFIKWWSKVPALQNRSFNFTPGLNILFGPNGCGKSTLLLQMAEILHAEQGGQSTVTESSLRKIFRLFPFHLSCDEKNVFDQKIINSINLKHDGQGIYFLNPSKEVGILSHQFDDDFLSKV